MTTNKALIDRFLSGLEKEFEITCSDMNLFLGIHIQQEANGSIFLHQEAYAERVIERYQLEDAHPVLIPADPNDEPRVFTETGTREKLTEAPYCSTNTSNTST